MKVTVSIDDKALLIVSLGYLYPNTNPVINPITATDKRITKSVFIKKIYISIDRTGPKAIPPIIPPKIFNALGDIFFKVFAI